MTSPFCSTASVTACRCGSAKYASKAAWSAGAVVIQSYTSASCRYRQIAAASSGVTRRISRRSVRTGHDRSSSVRGTRSVWLLLHRSTGGVHDAPLEDEEHDRDRDGHQG